MTVPAVINKSLQELFNEAVAGLASQHWTKSGIDGDGIGFLCQYRGPEGRRCAVGWLIPDALYSPDMEEADMTDSPARFLFPRAQWDVLQDLQQCHDLAMTDANMRTSLRRFAEERGLTLPVELADTSGHPENYFSVHPDHSMASDVSLPDTREDR